MKSRLTTLCYIERDDKYLMLHRVSKKNDINKDKWIGVGGHFEEGESPEDCLLREVKEETGLTLTSFRFRGIVTFCPEDSPTEYMCLYTADGFEGEISGEQCNEGILAWVDKKAVRELTLWDGDLLFLDLLERNASFFSLKLVYDREGRWRGGELDGRRLELLDLCLSDGTISGHVWERSMVHRQGKLHRTVHIWIIQRENGGVLRVLLQKRSKNKDAYPGCYDISSAGHVQAGDDFLPAALRELSEELGIQAQPRELVFIGFHEGYVESEFWGAPFRDWELSAVYLYDRPIEVKNLVLQESEVEEAVFMSYEELQRRMREGSLPNCIYPKELEMLPKALVPGYSPEGVRVVEKIV